MLYIPNENHEPALNLAREEYILCGKGLTEDVLFFYINDPSVIIGRHQNTLDEIDQDYIRANRISVVRRLSGGGAVYHDHGTLNFSFISPGDAAASADFSAFTAPIVKALHALGAEVELSGRNDLLLNGAKISGNAYYHNAHGSVCHGTLLFDTDLSVLSRALKPRPEKLLSKGIQSVRSHVCNLKPFLPGINNTQELEAAIVEQLLQQGNGIRAQELSEEDRKASEELANSRYRTEVWNYGSSPAFQIRKSIHKNCGWLDIRVDLRQDNVNNLRIFGDYFCPGDISEIERSFQGVDWNAQSISGLLMTNNWESCFPDFSADEFTEAFFSK